MLHKISASVTQAIERALSWLFARIMERYGPLYIGSDDSDE